MKLSRAVQFSFGLACAESSAMANSLRKATARLAPLRPASFSVSGGMTLSAGQRDAVRRISQDFHVKVMAVVSPRDVAAVGVETCAEYLREMGAAQLLLAPRRGSGSASLSREPSDGDGKALGKLVDGFVRLGFSVTIGAHPERQSALADAMGAIDRLKPAIDAGATGVIAEIFFDNDAFLAFEEHMRMRGVDVPIIPSLMPIVEFPRTSSMARAQGVCIPPFVREFFAGLAPGSETHRMVSAAFLANQIKSLVSRGVHEFHISTLDQPDLVYGACRMSGWNDAARCEP